MNILIVSQYFWPENFRINDFAAGLVERGHRVAVLTGIPNYPNGQFYEGYGVFTRKEKTYRGVKIIRIPIIPRGRSMVQRALNYLSFSIASCLMAPFKCNGQYDLIVVYGMSPITMALPAVLLRKLNNTPVLLWVQDLWPESLSATGSVRSQMLLGAVEKMVRFIYGNCDRILIQSRAFVDSIRGKGVPESKISYFPNSAETLYQPMAPNDDAADQLKMPAGFRIMYAGNIGAAQGFDSILDCAEMLRHYTDIHWVIFGDGCKSDWVMQEVERRRLTECVHIMGRHSIESMPKYFAVADAMLVSLRKDEIFALTIPAKVQSYLACGKPIIAALDGEGARIVTESGAGVASAAGHPGNLSDAVLTLYRLSESERAEMGARGRTYYETHFERETQLSRFEGMINELVAEGKGKDSLCDKKC